MKKLLIVLITITVLLVPIKAEASAPAIPYNPGISPSILSESEFTSWLLTLFGVRSHDTKWITNTDYINKLDEELRNQGVELDMEQIQNELYSSYLTNQYKVVIPKNRFRQLGEAIGSTFALASAINVQVTVPDGQGSYNANYTINVLNEEFGSVYNGVQSYTPTFDELFANFGSRIASIHAFKYSLGTDYLITNLIFALDEDWSIENNEAHFQSDWLLYSITTSGTECVGYGYAPKTKWDTLSLPSEGIIEIGKSNYIDGIVSINPDFTQALIDGVYSLVTPYTTDVEADTIEVAIPNNVGAILDGVTAGTISSTQAIEESKAIPIDTTSSAAVAGAIAAVTPLTLPTEYQTVGLSQFFPFCLPFDLIDFFRAFNATPKTPEFDIKLPTTQKVNGEIQYLEYHVDLHDFDGIADIVRKIETVAFCVLLCVFTRSRMIRS